MPLIRPTPTNALRQLIKRPPAPNRLSADERYVKIGIEKSCEGWRAAIPST